MDTIIWGEKTIEKMEAAAAVKQNKNIENRFN
jgi:hypothetical protein